MINYCREQFGTLKDLPTNLVQDSLNNARKQLKETIPTNELVEICCWIYLIGTGQVLGNQIIATKINPMERNIVWHLIKECFQSKQHAEAAFLFDTVEGLVAAELYIKY